MRCASASICAPASRSARARATYGCPSLLEEYDAVLLATGCMAAIRLPLRGVDDAADDPVRRLPNAEYGLDFLMELHRGEKKTVGKRVAVVGAGLHCARLRAGLAAPRRRGCHDPHAHHRGIHPGHQGGDPRGQARGHQDPWPAHAHRADHRRGWPADRRAVRAEPAGRLARRRPAAGDPDRGLRVRRAVRHALDRDRPEDRQRLSRPRGRARPLGRRPGRRGGHDLGRGPVRRRRFRDRRLDRGRGGRPGPQDRAQDGHLADGPRAAQAGGQDRAGRGAAARALLGLHPAAAHPDGADEVALRLRSSSRRRRATIRIWPWRRPSAATSAITSTRSTRTTASIAAPASRSRRATASSWSSGVEIKEDGSYGELAETSQWDQVGAIWIDNNECIRCGACYMVCPTKCISITKNEIFYQDV